MYHNSISWFVNLDSFVRCAPVNTCFAHHGGFFHCLKLEAEGVLPKFVDCTQDWFFCDVCIGYRLLEMGFDLLDRGCFNFFFGSGVCTDCCECDFVLSSLFPGVFQELFPLWAHVQFELRGGRCRGDLRPGSFRFDSFVDVLKLSFDGFKALVDIDVGSTWCLFIHVLDIYKECNNN